MQEIYGGLDPFERCIWPEANPSNDHRVLYQLPLLYNDKPPPPRPSKSGWKWDSSHVRMPCAPESQYPLNKSDGSSEVVNRWELIQTALLRSISSSHELEMAIFSYNSKYASSWNFAGLHHFFEQELDESESDTFFQKILPKIIELALQLPMLLPNAVPLLRSGQNVSLSMSQQQVACLLANAFLCTYPRRNTQKRDSEYRLFPDINFNRLFYSTQQSVMEKLKCLFNYFRRVTAKMPVGVITFRRRCVHVKYIPRFDKATTQTIDGAKLFVSATGTIENDGQGLLQVDFANKMIGGGVLGHGCVQEEIRFMICPELLVTRLFTECLRPNEALFVVGAEQFSTYAGYAGTFEWAGNFVDETPLDRSLRRKCQIVAIDALPFQDPVHQYRPELLLRELTKAYVGFGRTQQQQPSSPVPGIASGNWGCGAFNGSAYLKSLLQLMVCAVAERPLVYFTFGDQHLVEELTGMYQFLCERHVTVADLWHVLLKFSKQKSGCLGNKLFDFIYDAFKEERLQQQPRFGTDSQTSAATTAPAAAVDNMTIEPKRSETIRSTELSRNYSDTDDEMQVELERKKKLKSLPIADVNGREQKQAKVSLADCLESYFVKDNGNSGGCNDVNSSRRGAPIAIAHPTAPVKRFEVAIQMDDEGNEYIDASPPDTISERAGRVPGITPTEKAREEVAGCSGGRQTKLLDFFKKRNKK